jgi:hypothetical protein
MVAVQRHSGRKDKEADDRVVVRPAVLVGRREREGQQERRTQDAPAPMAVPILADEQRMGHCSRVTLRKNAHARLGESYGRPIRPQMNEF